MNRICASLALLLLSLLAFAQSNTPPTIKLSFPKQAKAGATVMGVVEVSFAEGLHGYQNPPSGEYQIPVAVSVNKQFKLVKAAYPKGIAKATGGDPTPAAVYEGTIRIPVTVKVPAKPGQSEMKISLNYQQCNASSCFPPSTVSSTVKLKVVKK